MSIPEILKLQGQLDIGLFQQGDGALQVVAVFAGDADFVALDRRLNFQLAVLDLLDNLFAERAVEPVPRAAT